MKKTFFKIFLLVATICLGFLFVDKTDVILADGCQVNNAKFRTNAPENDPDNFLYTDLLNPDAENRPIVYIDISTTNCVGETIKFSIFQNIDTLPNPYDRAINEADDLEILVNQDNFTLAYRAGEEWCGSSSLPSIASGELPTSPVIPIGNYSIFNVWDCKYYIEIEIDGEEYAFANQEPPNFASVVSFGGNTMLFYECSGLIPGCISMWQFMPVPGSVNNILDYEQSLTFEQGDQFVAGQGVQPLVPNEELLAPIPGYSDTCDNPPCSKLGNFLRSMFTIGIMVAGLLAFIMIVVGAITYTTGDSFSAKGAGKDMMLNAVLGLVLALGAWIILNTINPNLASNLGINIPKVTLEGDTDIFGTVFSNGTTDFSLPSNLGLYCPQSGGSGNVPQIIDSFVGKVTYRFGGKGGDLPTGQTFTQSSGNSDMCTNDSGGQQICGSFCPANSVCLDCSGFVNHVRKCAGLNVYNGTASMVNHDDAKPVSMSTLSSNGQSLTVEGQTYQLQPGDILVWNGHVVIYYGDGKIAESRGGSQGRAINGNIVKTPLVQYPHKNKITHIIKINP